MSVIYLVIHLLRDNKYMNQNIESICGVSDIIPDFEAIGNNPDYVFLPDPNFTQKVLYDIESNVVNVNSWLECANYVNGGWLDTLTGFVNYEKYLFMSLLIVSTISIIFIKLRKVK